MLYFKTLFTITSADAQLIEPARELLSAFAGECGYESFMETDEGLEGYIQQDYYDEQMLADCLADFPMEGVTITYTTEAVADQDWNETWETEQGFEPIVVDERLVIYDALHTDPSSLGRDYDIELGIRARNAFGTGTHETTRMMLRSILAADMTGKRVLDCGCGTGILGIAALKCGAREVVAYDIDEWSVENTKYNSMLNGVGDAVAVLEGDARVLSRVEGKFDVVLANINRNILLGDLPAFREKMAEGALLLLSGFYSEDVPMLESEARKSGLTLLSTESDNDWTRLAFR